MACASVFSVLTALLFICTEVHQLIFVYKLTAALGKMFVTHKNFLDEPVMDSWSIVSELVGVNGFFSFSMFRLSSVF
jgi:hypothetical protein